MNTISWFRNISLTCALSVLAGGIAADAVAEGDLGQALEKVWKDRPCEIQGFADGGIEVAVCGEKVKAESYTFFVKTRDVRNFFLSPGLASNTRVLYLYRIKDIPANRMASLLGVPGAPATLGPGDAIGAAASATVAYAMVESQSAPGFRYVGAPMIVKVSDKAEINMSGVAARQAFSGLAIDAIHWGLSIADRRGWAGEALIGVSDAIEGIEPVGQVLVHGTSKWNVYSTPKQAIFQTRRLEAGKKTRIPGEVVKTPAPGKKD